jgi:116 kDa U5 small nuclear ribonucleoprotein component
MISYPQSANVCLLLQVERLYTGPQDSDIAEHMRACNPKGPLVVHIAKLFPKSDCSAFDAFGRILSGTIKRGDRASLSNYTAWTHRCCSLRQLTLVLDNT